MFGRVEMLEQIDVTSKEGQAYVQAEREAQRRFGRHLVRDVRKSTRSSDTPEKRKKTLQQFIKQAEEARQRTQTKSPLRPGEVRKWNKETQSWDLI